jgi:hypothetical protein
MVDLETAVPTEPRQQRPMRVLVAGIVTAAAVVAIVLVASRFGDNATPSDEPSPTVAVTVPPVPPAQALFEQPTLGELEPGAYYVDEVDGTATPRIIVTVGDGWSHDGFWSIAKGDAIMTFSRPDRVFLDSCHPTDGYHAGPVTTLDGLAAALSEQGGWVDVTTPSDISVDGYAGKVFQRKTPADFSGCTPVQTSFMFPSWENGSELGQRGFSYYPPGDTENVLVLDVDTTIVILETRVNAGQPAAVHAEMAALLDSIRIDGG